MLMAPTNVSVLLQEWIDRDFFFDHSLCAVSPVSPGMVETQSSYCCWHERKYRLRFIRWGACCGPFAYLPLGAAGKHDQTALEVWWSTKRRPILSSAKHHQRVMCAGHIERTNPSNFLLFLGIYISCAPHQQEEGRNGSSVRCLLGFAVDGQNIQVILDLANCFRFVITHYQTCRDVPAEAAIINSLIIRKHKSYSFCMQCMLRAMSRCCARMLIVKPTRRSRSKRRIAPCGKRLLRHPESLCPP